jgi:Family of unknown function (DUF6353)
MRFVPTAISRKVAEQTLLARKNSPTILFGVGVVSMVGSTVLACRATLKMDEVLDSIEADKRIQTRTKEQVENGEAPKGVTYSDEEFKKDSYIILVQGVAKIVKLYAPAVILGGVGVVCLTKSHQILRERNAALTAAYIAVDTAFRKYRDRVVDRYGEETDRELRFEAEEVTVIDEETGKAFDTVRAAPGDPGMYARWFDETNSNFHHHPHEGHNWVWLRSQQNWCNDMLRIRGHVFLNEVYGCIGLTHTSAGSIVGWLYKRENVNGDNYIDFGCWDQKNAPLEFSNGREGAILLDFNVDGSIWELIDENVKENSNE